MINNINKIDSVLGSYAKASTPIKATQVKQQRDQVNLSETAQDFKSVFEAVSKVPDVREERVTDLTNRINSGQYNITSSDIANKILARY